ncbi:MAG: hypothetical protein LBU50_04885 [Cellulomonas sp.]|jgi:predicted transcriptional regulator|nr:hypothetical protein [Cellulomonas sp.]
MSTTTTIKISSQVHARLKAYAAAHQVPFGAAIDDLLAKDEQRAFWEGVAAQRPDADYQVDDEAGLADAEARIAAFEAGGR